MPIHATADDVRRQISLVLGAWGMPDDLIVTTAEAMVETDLMGVDSHGISMLMSYDAKFREGRLKLTARPEIENRTAVIARVNAGANLGHPVSVYGINLAVEMARGAGVGVVSVHNSHHFGAAGYYARLAAEQGLIGIVMSSARGITVVPTRAAKPVLGTNPMAFAIPAGKNRPFVLDMATSTVAVGKVKVYSFNERPLPAGWVADGKGNPVTDATRAFAILMSGRGGHDVVDDGGGLTPIGGTPELSSHKGYGLGVLAHLLGGALSGANFSPRDEPVEDPADPENIGHFFMALDPQAFRPAADFAKDVDDVIDILHNTTPSDPNKPVLVAGDPEDAIRAQRLTDGIPIPDALAGQLKDVCRRANIEYVLKPIES
jgi:LDH2 family malate/lactate/ureidoglycolate dehydrogenase